MLRQEKPVNFMRLQNRRKTMVLATFIEETLFTITHIARDIRMQKDG